MRQLFANCAASLLASPITTTSTYIPVLPGTINLFPNPGPDEFFLVTLENEEATIREIIKIDSRSNNMLHVMTGGRGQENTIALAWPSDPSTLVDHRVTAQTLVTFQNDIINVNVDGGNF